MSYRRRHESEGLEVEGSTAGATAAGDHGMTCEKFKVTRWGWAAFCTQPVGHLGQHSSADFAWSDSDPYARLKEG